MPKETNKKQEVKKQDSKKQDSKNKRHFMKDFKAELKRVIWPTPKQLLNNTVAVITIVLVTAVIVLVLDFAFESINTYGINKLKEIVDDTNSVVENIDSNTVTTNTTSNEIVNSVTNSVVNETVDANTVENNSNSVEE